MAARGDALLAGLRVVDLTGEPAQMAGRILADLGADVLKVEPPGGDPLRAHPLRFAAWNAGKRSLVVDDADDPRIGEALAGADVVLDTPGWPGVLDLDPSSAPDAVWVSVTPFGLDGPRAHWRATDLGIMASSGNMYCTGDPDRAPIRCAEPTAYAHTGPEVAFAALSALASGRPQRVDVSMQEVVLIANMGGPGRYLRTGFRGKRTGAQTGRTREIWTCKDGFVSFGLRGGKARQPTLRAISELVGDPVLTGRDWSTYSHVTATEDDLRAIEEPITAWFAQRTMAELYELACERNLMLAPTNSPRELYASQQLRARNFFADVDEIKGLPHRFVVVRSADGNAAPAEATSPPPPLPLDATGPEPNAHATAIWARPHEPGTSPEAAGWPAREGPRPWGPTAGGEPAERPTAGGDTAEGGNPPGQDPAAGKTQRARTGGKGSGAWAGVRILELGSGAAGPIATRYFAEHGATVLRIESKTRPDFLRTYALGPDNPHGLEGSDMFDTLNCGKLDVTLNLKHPKAVELAKRLVHWADAICENFAPKAMKGFGLDYDTLAAEKPDLVMISACLQGQTGPHRNYPGFGGQGAALSGWNFLTGWPDRYPLGPYGTITDSLAPRFVAAALAAGLLYRRRTGRGVYLDLAQVEAGAFALSPWLLQYANNGETIGRMGNRSRRAAPHGAFPCAGDDRWVAIAVWDDDEWERLAKVVGLDVGPGATLAARLERQDEIEQAIAAWTATRSRDEVAEALQGAGVEAVPVADFADLQDDPQVVAREHFVPLTHPFMGPGLYERNGFRLSDADAGWARSGPTLGQDNDLVLGEILGLSPEERATLAADGVFD